MGAPGTEEELVAKAGEGLSEPPRCCLVGGWVGGASGMVLLKVNLWALRCSLER